MKDSLDHKYDMSDWVLTAHGFIPVPYLITEPALGGIGGAIMPVFVDLNTPYLDTIDGKLVKTRAKPNLYGVGGAYTANGTKMLAGAAMGTIKKWRLNYRLVTAYAYINLIFYKEIPKIGEQSFEFNIKTIPVYAQLIKQFKGSNWFVGMNYIFLKTELARTNAEFHTPRDVKAQISRPGILLEYDNRDNVFTPNKGFRWNTQVASSNEIFGSDYNYTNLNSAAFWYAQVTKRIVSGLRVEAQQVFGDAPFYMMPFLNMRGMPLARYQGKTTALAETEWRWDFTSRWSLVAFGGAGKAIQGDNTFQSSAWHYSGGGGGRYLIARKMNLRAGIDVARGQEVWAYYIVFGTSWVR